jgi:hypothetical protein
MIYGVDFGPTKTGLLGQVGYTQYDADGAQTVARSTVGVFDLGNGAYGHSQALHAQTVILKWDTGELIGPLYAHDTVELPAQVQALWNTAFKDRFWDKAQDKIFIYTDATRSVVLYEFDVNDDLSDISPV